MCASFVGGVQVGRRVKVSADVGFGLFFASVFALNVLWACCASRFALNLLWICFGVASGFALGLLRRCAAFFFAV